MKEKLTANLATLPMPKQPVDQGNFANELDWPRKMGVEIELFIVDAETGQPLAIGPEIVARVDDGAKQQVRLENLACQIELVSRPHSNLSDLRADLAALVDEVAGIALTMGAKLLWSGSHPRLDYETQVQTESTRSAHNRRRLGGAIEALGMCGIHFHVEVTQDEAIRVVDGLQTFLPLLVALTANSPIKGGRNSGFRSKRASNWNGQVGVSGFSGPYHDWGSFKRQMANFKNARRIETPKDNYSFVRPTTLGTVEVRCCDTPMNLDQVIAVGALVKTLVEAIANGDLKVKRTRDFLAVEFHEAALRGPEGNLTNHCGELVSPVQWLNRLASELQLTAMMIDTDLALRLAPSYLLVNGSTEQLAKFEREEQRRAEEVLVLPVSAKPAPASPGRLGWSLAAAAAALVLLLAQVVV